MKFHLLFALLVIFAAVRMVKAGSCHTFKDDQECRRRCNNQQAICEPTPRHQRAKCNCHPPGRFHNSFDDDYIVD